MKISVFLISILIHCTCNAQLYQEKLCNVFSTLSGPSTTGVGSFSFDQTYSASGSTWQVDWSENTIFNGKFKYELPSNPNQSFELRIGKGGQIYSFKSAGFGEALPPQWRPSYNTSGTAISDQGISNPINSSHGNWAPWVDEVWQLVGSDQKDMLSGAVSTKNIHQAGSYMNNYAHRASDLTQSPFFSPMIQSYFDPTNQSFTVINWGQSENPEFAYNPTAECDVCYPDPFKSSVLYYNRYKNIGNGVIQVDFLVYNFSRERGIDYWSVPFIGIRNSSLPYAFISNSATNAATYNILNILPGHPNASNPTAYLPNFGEGALKITSGGASESSGWIAFSNTLNGNGPSLAFVTAKSSSNPSNGYGDMRYGTAMSNPIRDVTIFARRAIGGAVSPTTGLKPWGIKGGQSIQGRYFIVLDATLPDIVQTIQNKNLVSNAKIEKVTILQDAANNVNYNFSLNANGTYSAVATSLPSPSISLNSKPFVNSYPVFLIKTANSSFLSSNPYTLSLKPYDGTMKSMELLGFSSSYKETENINAIVSIELLDFRLEKVKNNQIKLFWKTGTEINNDYFLLEKSKDALHWNTLDKVKGAGNSNAVLNYQTIDYAPNSGITYYRLKQTDFDGSSSYSKILSCLIDDDASSVIYPNPAKEFIYLECKNGYSIFNLSGQLLQKSNYPTSQINISDLLSGTYYIVTGNKTRKFIIE